MKRLFILISMVLVSLYMVITSVDHREEILFGNYPSVDVTGMMINQPVASREEVTEALSHLAVEHNSLIARRIVEPNEAGETLFTYATYGEGELPEGLTISSKESAETSDLLGSYLIVSGSLDGVSLQTTLKELGYQGFVSNGEDPFSIVLLLAATPMVLLSLAIFLLTFMSLTLIYRIKSLRQAGISTLLSVVYLLGLQENSLVDLLKGKLPLKRMMTLMMVGQLLAVLVVGSSATALLPHYREMQEMERASNKWSQSSDRYRLSFGWSSAFADEEGTRKDNREWQTFTEERLANTDSFYIMSNVDNFSDGAEVDLDGNRLSDYTPLGNVIYVSPRYLIEEKITVSSEFMDKMQNLSEGEFGLILPESLREQSAYYQGLFTDYLQNFSSESVEVTSQKHYLPQVRLAFTETGQERFLYNDGYKTTRQYLKDPIIVVLTPQATGTRPVAGMLWGTTANSALKLDRYGDSITALKEQGLYHKVSYLVKSQLFFAKVLNDKRVEFYSLLIGTILTLSTAILLFDSMNLLYFEQFRRELMIKRLAGMTIYELHGKYLLAQGGVLLLGLVLSSILTRDGLISALVVALFTLNALLILVRQDKKEEAGSMAVLKGK
ncbi:TPA: bacteriocin-associated integral membrane family protein [Streptococcus pneumoniae]|nr:bacteriocin-associated integral membrane family protein [Streptococcus pneumoniae]HET4505893.1 bacteriocin-associated integral membrane family protein [Streptococcus pneumoniae]HET8157994.1 bacteriocin-associated integral membrane family protein [Streptococcus pneumoniae]HEU1237608.1 bacteriocin-associated integral membrane family protein [Streptococcus pneumoniae]HEU1515676.1 bacteriocin-associated integral membrane family protein [Streptococcus pneumoniae]